MSLQPIKFKFSDLPKEMQTAVFATGHTPESFTWWLDTLRRNSEMRRMIESLPSPKTNLGFGRDIETTRAKRRKRR